MYKSILDKMVKTKAVHEDTNRALAALLQWRHEDWCNGTQIHNPVKNKREILDWKWNDAKNVKKRFQRE